MEWDYDKCTCRLTMNGYIPQQPQHTPHMHGKIVYGAKAQLIPDVDTSPTLDPSAVKHIQAIVRAMLYYAQAIDNKLHITTSATQRLLSHKSLGCLSHTSRSLFL